MRVYRPWSLAEKALVRGHYATKGSLWVAARLGRTLGSVWAMARRLGVAHAQLPPVPEAALRDLLGEGLPWAEVAARLGVGLFRLKAWAARRGIRAVCTPGEARRRGLARSALRAGYRSHSHRCAARMRVRALRLRPGCFTLGEVSVCSALDAGPGTVADVVARTGRHPAEVYRATAALAARGVIEAAGMRPRPGRGLPPRVWRLAPRSYGAAVRED